MCLVLGAIMHFLVLFRLEKAGISVKYFGSTDGWFGTYKQYSQISRERGWSLWPLYIVYCSYAALLVAGFMLAIDRPLLRNLIRLGK
jgi:hypothetical protein